MSAPLGYNLGHVFKRPQSRMKPIFHEMRGVVVSSQFAMKSIVTVIVFAVVAGFCLAQEPVEAPPVPVPIPYEDAAAPVVPPPSIEWTDPNTAPLAGGISVTVYGTHFNYVDEGLVVTFGNRPAANVIVQNGETITCVVPPLEQSGPTEIKVINPDGKIGALRAKFCYVNGNRLTGLWFRLKLRAYKFWQYVRLTGWLFATMFAIMSICGLAWGLHCLFAIRRREIMPDTFMEEISARLSRGELDEATRLCGARDYVFSRIVLAGLRKANDFPEQIRDAMDSAGSREASHLQQKISYLSNIGVIAPMVGLLGTVWGMILAFGAIKDQASRGLALAGALYQAMTTTVTGLLIGIVAMSLFFYLRGRVLRLSTEMEETAEKVAEAIISVGEME